MRKKILIYTILGTVFAVFAGSGLHFLFDGLGQWKPAALIAAVNESTWEHLKLAFWPMFFWSLIEYLVWAKNQPNYCIAKAVSFYFAPIFIVLGFYGHKLFFPGSLVYDIGLFVVSIILAQIIAYKILLSQKDLGKYQTLAIAMVVVALLSFSLLSYFPLKNILFLDPVTNNYGLIHN